MKDLKDYDDEIDYKFINYTRDEDGIDLWIKDNAPIRLEDEYDLLVLCKMLQLIKNEIERMPF